MAKDERHRKVRSVLRQLGLQEPQRHDRYLSNLKRKFGAAATAVLSEIDRKSAGDPTAAVYGPKNASPELSLAITSQEFYAIHEAFLVWLLGELESPPKRILDLGCEAGVLSLALAKLWPDAEIIGIDREPAAIAVARELATRHGITRARFEAGDLFDLDVQDLGRFDLVLAVAVFHEALDDVRGLPGEEQLGFSIEETPAWDHGRGPDLERLRAFVAPDGLLVAVNRWSTAERLSQWIRTMESASWSTAYNSSFLLVARHRYVDEEVLPITVHLPESPTRLSTDDDVLGFYAYRQFQDHQSYCLEGPPAEALRRSLGTSERVIGVEVDHHDGSGTERLEILAAGPLAARYVTSSRGYRHIILGALSFLPEMLHAVNEFAGQKATLGELRVLAGDGDPDRWKNYGVSFTVPGGDGRTGREHQRAAPNG